VSRRTLRIGALSAILDGADFRYIRFGDLEIARRIYVAVRDIAWRTVLPQDVWANVEEHDHELIIRCGAHHEHGPVIFDWEGSIAVTETSITYEMDGVAGGTFDYARVGLCLHHPMESAGRPYHGTSQDGSIAGTFPDTIAAQIHVGEIDLPVFPPVTALTVMQSDEVAVDFTWNGERFEMEDHRNWSDASFKSYPKPADLGYAFHATAGERLQEKMTVAVRSVSKPRRRHGRSRQRASIRIEIGPSLARSFPAVGFGLPSHGQPSTTAETNLIRSMHPSHLRVDLRLAAPGWQDVLNRAVREAGAIGCAIELAIFLREEPERELAALATYLAGDDWRVDRVLVLHELEETTRPLWIAAARGQLRLVLPGAQFFGGTNGYFNELNRNRECIDGADGLAFSLNPQVHAFDDLSLMENLAAQPETIRTARSFAGPLPVAVTPITLRPRPAATRDAMPGATEELPFEVDPRQFTLVGAAWSLASVGLLAGAGATSLTYFETSGWLGVTEREHPSRQSTRVASPALSPYPMFHVFADIGEWRGADLADLRIADQTAIGGIACGTTDTSFLAIANLTEDEQRVEVGPYEGDVHLRRLNDASASLAARDHVAFRADSTLLRSRGHLVSLTLSPYEVARIDVGRKGSSS
jgi:hypothetical protein